MGPGGRESEGSNPNPLHILKSETEAQGPTQGLGLKSEVLAQPRTALWDPEGTGGRWGRLRWGADLRFG